MLEGFKEKVLRKKYVRVHIYEMQGDMPVEVKFMMMPDNAFGYEEKTKNYYFDLGEKRYWFDLSVVDKDIKRKPHLRFDKNDAIAQTLLGKNRQKLIDPALLYIQTKKEILKAKYGRAGPETKLPWIVAVGAMVALVAVVYILTQNLQPQIITVTPTPTSPPITVRP